jgi:hypothetical protein
MLSGLPGEHGIPRFAGAVISESNRLRFLYICLLSR